MIRYKHRETGIIGECTDFDNFLHYSRCSGNICTKESIPLILITGGKDWDEINYKILLVEHSSGIREIPQNHNETKLGRTCKIIEVLKLSTGETFKLGDKIKHCNNVTYKTGKVTKFEIMSNAMFIETNNSIKGFDTNICFVSNITEKELFTTEDGVKIYKDQGCWGVRIGKKDSVDRVKMWDIVENIGTITTPDSEYYKAFSTLENAEYYVFINKPVLSAIDVIEYLAKSGHHSTLTLDPRFITLLKTKQCK